MERIFRPDGTVRRRWRQPDTPRWLDSHAEKVEMYELNADSVYHAWELAQLAEDGLSLAQEKALVRLVLASLVSMRQGSTRLRVDVDGRPWFSEHFAEVVPPDDFDDFLEQVETLKNHPALTRILGRPGEYKPLILEGPWLYHQRTLHHEIGLVEALFKRDAASLAELDGRDAAIEDVVAFTHTDEFGLVSEQVNALHAALSAPLSIITGGPGTGKTSIVVSLLRVLRCLKIPVEAIALAAPTGKAANRMAESIRTRVLGSGRDEELALIEPSTLHRLLDYSRRRGEFRHGQDNPLKQSIVIVDEASMIDLVLMRRLVAAVRPDARLVLLGDAEQLPSVDTGTVLRDLIPDGGTQLEDRRVVRLHHSFRMDASRPEGRAILEVAEAVRSGRDEEAWSKLTLVSDASDIAFRGVEAIEPTGDDDRASFRRFLDRWYEARIASFGGLRALALDKVYTLRSAEFTPSDVEGLDRLFAHFNRSRILCLTRVFATGSNAINARFHARALQHFDGLSEATQFVPGEPVLMLKNDYERHLFNGDQGLILRVDTDGNPRFMAVFPDGRGYQAHHLAALRGHLDHAYAMTVHKSQGSEFDDVALVLPDEDLPLLTREILYTAVTRARESVVVFGQDELFKLGVRRQIRRYSGVRARLSDHDVQRPEK